MIQIDFREHDLIKLITPLLINTKVDCSVLNLDIGDIIIGDRVIIERKTISDLNSFSSKELNEFTHIPIIKNKKIYSLYVQNINVITNSSTPNIVVPSPIAFSILKSDYSTNNFSIYPIYFS